MNKFRRAEAIEKIGIGHAILIIIERQRKRNFEELFAYMKEKLQKDFSDITDDEVMMAVNACYEKLREEKF